MLFVACVCSFSRAYCRYERRSTHKFYRKFSSKFGERRYASCVRQKRWVIATRLKIFEYISASSTPEVCVCDIVDYVQKSQATVSHHLRILRDANLIVGERRGTWVWYQVESGVFF